jgi:hypothetical protein
MIEFDLPAAAYDPGEQGDPLHAKAPAAKTPSARDINQCRCLICLSLPSSSSLPRILKTLSNSVMIIRREYCSQQETQGHVEVTKSGTSDPSPLHIHSQTLLSLSLSSLPHLYHPLTSPPNVTVKHERGSGWRGQ